MSPAARAPAFWAFPAMLTGSALLSFGPWLVRLSDVGEVSSAFWRVALAVAPLFLLVRMTRAKLPPLKLPLLGAVAVAGAAFAIDLALWHLGITRTTLANAALLSNAASFLLPLYGFVVLKARPTPPALAALGCALLGTALLMGGSAELSPRHLAGDLLCLLCAVFYTVYLVFIDRLRGTVAALPLLALATAFAAVTMLPLALVAPGAFWPANWWPLIGLALGAQVLGQGLIVFAVGHLKPLVVGLTLLVQPAVAAVIGALRFGEIPGPIELAGAALVVAALVLVRLPARLRDAPG